MTSLEKHGIETRHKVHWDLTAPGLYEQVIRRREAKLIRGGALLVDTVPYTGRSPRDKYVVRDPDTESEIWWGDVNQPMDPSVFDDLYQRVASHLGTHEIFVQDLRAGADPLNRISVRIITESPWHALFCRNMFIVPREPLYGPPDFTIIHAPEYRAVPERDGTRSEVFICINFARRILMIGGTSYSGEMKKSVFSVMNYLLPKRNVLTMHASATVGREAGDSAVIFGLSGTGKTTLATDPTRLMVGDDEIGWGTDGIFNIEGGSYAKVIDLSEADEPLIYEATTRFESILENVALDPVTGEPAFKDHSKTENTRCSYPLTHLRNVHPTMTGPHPDNLVFLSADAFGVLPPIARLSKDQAMYYFISGYTAKLAGTERGINEPSATFSACFGEPFLALAPAYYAEVLSTKLNEHDCTVWMINTGWSGGPVGVGSRIPIPFTRTMLNAALSGQLSSVNFETDPVFGLEVPVAIPGVPDTMLQPRNAWDDVKAFDSQAEELSRMFARNIARYDGIATSVLEAGPVATS